MLTFLLRRKSICLLYFIIPGSFIHFVIRGYLCIHSLTAEATYIEMSPVYGWWQTIDGVRTYPIKTSSCDPCPGIASHLSGGLNRHKNRPTTATLPFPEQQVPAAPFYAECRATHRRRRSAGERRPLLGGASGGDGVAWESRTPAPPRRGGTAISRGFGADGRLGLVRHCRCPGRRAR